MRLDHELHFAAARYVLGTLPAEEIVVLARRSVDRGSIPPAVCELATNRDEYPTVRELAPLFEEWLAEEGIEVPEREAAVWGALRGWITRIAAREIPPPDGLTQIMRVHDEHLADKSSRVLGDSHGIEHLVGGYYERDDILEQHDVYGDGALQELDQAIIDRAEAWLRDHPS